MASIQATLNGLGVRGNLPIEAMNPGDEQWGEEGIIEIALDAAAHAETAAVIAGRIVQGAQMFAAGAPQHDDMTVMVLRFTQ